jgi:uncharacterized protein (TIGR02300 family)
MVKAEWGAKRVCPSCGARFYDLLKDPVTCPMCQSSFSLEELLKVKKTRAVKADAKKTTKKSATPTPMDDEDILTDDDDVLLDDDDELGDFGDDDTLLEDDGDDDDLDGFQVESDDDEDDT